MLKAADEIMRIIDKKGLSQTQAASMIGISRQSLYDRLNVTTPKYSIAADMVEKLGYKIEVCRDGGGSLGFDQEKLKKSLNEENVTFDSCRRILLSMGIMLKIVEK